MLSAIDFTQLPQRKRAALINCVTGYKPANLIGTANAQTQSNVAIFSSCVHLGSDPALVGFVQRPASVERHTYENIIETGVATLNHVHPEMVAQAHHTAARYPRDISEFTAAGLTEQWRDDFAAPFVGESRFQLALSFVEAIEIKANNTLLMVMQIDAIYTDERLVADDGYLDMDALNSAVISGLDSYHSVAPLERLAYAKPRQELLENADGRRSDG